MSWPRSEMPPAAILAGGLATRLRPLTDQVPKSLLDIGGQPFIAHQLRLLRSQGLEHVVLCVGHLGEMIHDAVGDGSRFGLRVDYSFDGAQLLGTAGAVKRALPLLDDPFFTLYGDSYLECDYRAVADTLARSGALALMTVFRNEGRWDTSNVEYSGGRVLAYDKIHRTERMRHIDWGLGLFTHAAFAQIPERQAADLATVYQRSLASDQLAAFEVDRRFYEMGSPQGIEEMRAFIHRRGHEDGSLLATAPDANGVETG